MAAEPVGEGWLPRVVEMATLRTRPGDGFGGHEHRYDEFCMVAGSSTTITHAGEPTHAAHGACYLFKAGEWHGYRNNGRQAPDLWVLHFWPDGALLRECPPLGRTDPRDRIWQLDERQVEEFRTMFMRVQQEQDDSRMQGQAAAAAWLRLLAITLARWRSPQRAQGPALPSADPELMRLWELLNAHVGSSDGLAETLRRELPNYDSLRHRFTRVFRASPRQALMTLRMRRAKSMLLEGDLPIATIAERLGYARQHEFTRAFHREVGRPPAAWRASGGDAVRAWTPEAADPERRQAAPARLKTRKRRR